MLVPDDVSITSIQFCNLNGTTHSFQYDTILYDIFVNCNWVVTRWQQYSTHLHTNNTQNDTKQTIHRTAQQFWKSAGRAPSSLVIPWHLPYNRGKSTEKPQSG